MRRIAAHWLVDRGKVTQRPVVTLADDGQIVAVEQWESLDSMAQTEFYAGALTAGFVNAHCHIELSYLRGKIERGSGFAGFARAIGQVRGLASDEERMAAIAATDAKMYSEGVEVVADIVNGTTSMPTKSKSRILYHSFAEVFGLLSTTEPMLGLLQYDNTTLTPHSTYSLQEKVFGAITEQRYDYAHDAPLSVHFMESPDEKALYVGKGSLAEWYTRMGWECDFLHYGSPAGRIVGQIAADRKVLLVHNCCIEEEDFDLIEKHFQVQPSWVVCPCSNDYISGLRPPLELLRRRGAEICIGTDSLASNEELTMVGEMKRMSEVPLAELVEWATINGARALGVDREKGSIEVGKRAGVVLLEGVEQDTEGVLRIGPETTSRRLA